MSHHRRAAAFALYLERVNMATGVPAYLSAIGINVSHHPAASSIIPTPSGSVSRALCLGQGGLPNDLAAVPVPDMNIKANSTHTLQTPQTPTLHQKEVIWTPRSVCCHLQVPCV